MLKIKDSVDLKKLYSFGFRLDQTRTFYEKDEGEFKIFIWITSGDRYTPRGIYIENTEGEPIIYELDTLFDLINLGLVEKV